MRNVTILGSLSLLKYINRTDIIIINLFNNNVTIIGEVQRNVCLSNFSVSNVYVLLNLYFVSARKNKSIKNTKKNVVTKIEKNISITPSSYEKAFII